MNPENEAHITVEIPSSSSARSTSCALMQLDPEGDIILVVNRRFLMTNHEESDLRGEKVDPTDLASGTALSASGLGNHENANPPIESVSQASLDPSLDIAIACSPSISGAEQEPFSKFQVSSRHLALASPVFKGMVQCGLTQSQQLQSQSSTEVVLQDDDPDALLILLRLIHGRFRQVPRTVALGTLTQIAILVDKYELFETTDPLIDQWLLGAKETLPAELNDDLLSWMFIAGVFKDKSISKRVSQIARFESKGLLKARNLPIPGQDLVMIDSCRQNALCEIFTYLEQTQDRLLCQQSCLQDISCSAMALGFLMKGLNALNLLKPPPPPYENFSVKDVFEGLREVQVPQHCKDRQKKRAAYISESDFCEGVKNALMAKMKELEHELMDGHLVTGKT